MNGILFIFVCLLSLHENLWRDRVRHDDVSSVCNPTMTRCEMVGYFIPTPYYCHDETMENFCTSKQTRN